MLFFSHSQASNVLFSLHRNRIVRKLAVTLGHLSFENYLRTVQLFFSYHNMKVRLLNL